MSGKLGQNGFSAVDLLFSDKLLAVSSRLQIVTIGYLVEKLALPSAVKIDGVIN